MSPEFIGDSDGHLQGSLGDELPPLFKHSHQFFVGGT